MTVLSVGPGATYTTIAQAYAAAASGDTISVNPAGNPYDMSTSLSLAKNIDFVSSVPRTFVKITAKNYVSNSKAPFATNANITFTWFEFTGIVGPYNVAAIRFESGNLSLFSCYVHDFLGDGILAGEGSGTAKLVDCEFGHLGDGGGLTHLAYFGKQASVIVQNCYFHDCDNGNTFKSRALNTTITDTRLFDGAGAGIYQGDFPNGGVVKLTRVVIQQGANPNNKSICEVGAERDNTNPAYGIYTPSSFSAQDCTVVNDCTAGAYLLNNPFGISPITWDNTKIYDVSNSMGNVPPGMTNTTKLTTRPALDTRHPWDIVVAPPAPPPPPPAPPPPPPAPPPPPPPVVDPQIAALQAQVDALNATLATSTADLTASNAKLVALRAAIAAINAAVVDAMKL